MPEETLQDDVTPQGAGAAPDSAAGSEPASTPEPEIRYASADTIVQPDPSTDSADDGASGQVPSYRLREETSRRREAENAAQLIAQQNLILQNQLNQQQQSVAPAPGVPDELLEPFGNDEEGQKALRAVRGVSQHETREALDQFRGEIRQELQQEFDTKLGSVTASITMAEDLAGMKTRGLIDDNAEKEIGRRMGEQIRQNPAWGQKGNQEHLLNKVWTDMLRNGDIRPTTQPATPREGGNSPLQPGGSRPTEKQLRDNNDAELREIQERFPNSFQGKTIEQLRSLGGPQSSTVEHGSRQPQQQQQTQLPSQRTFVHTRE